MTKEETEAAVKAAAEEVAKNGEASQKHSSTFFDLGKARQTVYSILMGFVLKYFIEHTYEMWDIVCLLDTPHKIVYSCILIYFFLNCFRFLFGLVDYSNMADDKFAPQDKEWKKGNIRMNTQKLYVINTGLFQLTVFSFSVFLIFPHFGTASLSLQDKVSALMSLMPEIIIAFSVTTFILLFIDVTSLYYYRKHVVKDEHKYNEEVKFLIWTVSDILEIAVAIILFILILFSRPECATIWEMILLIILVVLVAFENVSGYKYFEKPLKNLRDALKEFRKKLKEKAKEE